MNATLISLIVIAVYFVYIGWHQRIRVLSRPTEPGELRAAGFFETIASIFTVVGAGEYALAITLVAVYGVSGPSLFLGLGLALFAIGAVARRVRIIALARRTTTTTCDGYPNFTTPDLFYSCFGRWCSVASTGITALAFTGILWLQFILGGELISNLAGVSYHWGVILIGVVVLMYLCLGRFPAIFHTDVYQGLFMWVTLYVTVGYLFFVRTPEESVIQAVTDVANASVSGITHAWVDPTAFTILISTVVAAFAGPDLWQRVTMAPGHDEAARGTWLAGVAMLLFALPLMLLGIDVVASVPAESSEPFVAYAATLGRSGGEVVWPVWLQVLFTIGLLSAFLSTADTSAMLVSTAILNEIRRVRDTAEQPRRELPISALCVIVALVVSVGVFAAISAKGASLLFTGVLGILAAQGLPFFLAIFGRGTRWTCFAALCLGAIFALALTFVWPSYNEGYWILLPIAPGVICILGRAQAESQE